MVALVLSAWHTVGAQQITDFLPSSPDIPGFTIPTLSVFLNLREGLPFPTQYP